MSSSNPPIPPINLPPPCPGQLHGDYILGEMLDHLSYYEEIFTRVKFDELRQLLSDVRNHSGDREIAYRSFLRAFEGTTTYQNAFRELDPETRGKIGMWLDGEEAGVLSQDGFVLPLSPGAKRHFAHLQKVRDIVRGLKDVEEKGISSLFHHASGEEQETLSDDAGSVNVARLKEEMEKVAEVWADVENTIQVEVTHIPNSLLIKQLLTPA